jgi:hypothetical protein
MTNVYFNEKGITSTEGNHLCNIAKELQQAAINRLNSVKFFKTTISVIGSNEKQLMSKGNESLDFIEEDLQLVASLNAFCAWVREAIKEKEKQNDCIKQLSLEEWITLFDDIKMPEKPIYPSRLPAVTEQSIIDNWDINKRNKYLELEAFASTIGKYIHPNGEYSCAREKAHNAINKPISKEGSGRDTVLYHTTPSINIEDVDNLYMFLQSKHREYEKQLNMMKAEIKESVTKLTVENNQHYENLLEIYRKEYSDYNSKLLELRSQYNTWITKTLENISKYKIAIPNNLKETFNLLKKISDTSK